MAKKQKKPQNIPKLALKNSSKPLLWLRNGRINLWKGHYMTQIFRFYVCQPFQLKMQMKIELLSQEP